MRVFHHLEAVPAEFGPTVLSVGNFDGVHRAHRHVLSEVVKRAQEIGGRSMVVTFDPHPTRILRPDVAPKLITPLPRKLELLTQTGIDATLVLPFTRDLSLTTAEDFARNILGRRLHAREVHEGENFHFGHRAAGDTKHLMEYGREAGFLVKAYPYLQVRGDKVSSSRIRQLLREGDVGQARQLLGWVFSLVSTPGRGRGYGHKYTVPTINLTRYDELVPKDGVYVTRTQVNGECFDSVTNVGTRPTFGVESFAIETHLLNFHPIDLTAETKVELWFLYRLRDEMRFPSVEDLRAQIANDVHHARRYLRLLNSVTRP